MAVMASLASPVSAKEILVLSEDVPASKSADEYHRINIF